MIVEVRARIRVSPEARTGYHNSVSRPSDITLRSQIRRATARQHERLDRLVAARGSFESVAAYIGWLFAMRAFFGSLGKAFDEFEGHGGEAGHRMAERVDCLTADLTSLEASYPLEDGGAAFSISDESEALGVLYVAEGAKLGARLLVGKAHRLGLSAERGARFLEAEARNLASWMRVSAALEAIAPDDERASRIIAASRRTFDLAAHCFGAKDG